MKVLVSTPSRICLFGEHQDYLGLEVIASAIDLRFSAAAHHNGTRKINISIRDSSISQLGQKNTDGKYEHTSIDLDEPLTYQGDRDYFRSAIRVLQNAGFTIEGADIRLDSEIPIGKGMCSSTTMVLVYLTALAALADPERAKDPAAMALLTWKAEVEEFNEPGGMMDQYASALGGLVHLNFANGTEAEAIKTPLTGKFILFDSLQQKDTIKVLGGSKYPTQEALKQLAPYGITSIRDFYEDPSKEEALSHLDELHRRKVLANIDNYRIQREAYAMLTSGQVDDVRLGELLDRHQANLRDGLGISTPIIDSILAKAKEKGAYGGKFNGSGGGGCLYVYTAADKAQTILDSVAEMGYPGTILSVDKGLTVKVED